MDDEFNSIYSDIANDEDLLRMKAISESIANTTYDAFKRRFKNLDKDSSCIIFSSLIDVTAKLMMELPKEEIENTLAAFIVSLYIACGFTDLKKEFGNER